MAMSATGALYTAINARLRASLAGTVGDRVQALAVATAGIERPYVVFFQASHLRLPMAYGAVRHRYTVSVKAVADTMAQASALQDGILWALDDTGAYDGNTALSAAGYTIATVSAGRAIWLEEMVDSARRIYHAGYQFVIEMEAD
jgi:hypothetical protein